MAFAVSRGEANVYLVLVIPVIVGTGPLALLGVFLVFAGFLLTFLLWPSRLVPQPDDCLQGGLDPRSEPQSRGSRGSRRGQYRRGGGDRPKDPGRERPDREHDQRRGTGDRPCDLPLPAPSGGGSIRQGRPVGKEETRGPGTV